MTWSTHDCRLGYPVQGFSAEDTSEDRHTCEPVTCPACRQIHHVNPATGAIFRRKSRIRFGDLCRPPRRNLNQCSRHTGKSGLPDGALIRCAEKSILMILVSKPTGLRRLPISLLGLKTGTLLSRTPTLTPLLGFRPMRPADRQFAALHQLRDDCHSSMGFPHIFHVVVECADSDRSPAR